MNYGQSANTFVAKPVFLKDKYGSTFDESSDKPASPGHEEINKKLEHHKKSRRNFESRKQAKHNLPSDDIYGQRLAREKLGLTIPIENQLKRMALDEIVVDTSG